MEGQLNLQQHCESVYPSLNGGSIEFKTTFPLTRSDSYVEDLKQKDFFLQVFVK